MGISKLRSPSQPPTPPSLSLHKIVTLKCRTHDAVDIVIFQRLFTLDSPVAPPAIWDHHCLSAASAIITLLFCPASWILIPQHLASDIAHSEAPLLHPLLSTILCTRSESSVRLRYSSYTLLLPPLGSPWFALEIKPIRLVPSTSCRLLLSASLAPTQSWRHDGWLC